MAFSGTMVDELLTQKLHEVNPLTTLHSLSFVIAQNVLVFCRNLALASFPSGRKSCTFAMIHPCVTKKVSIKTIVLQLL